MDSSPTAAPPRLSWPPPGLEHVYGRLGRLVVVLGFGDLALVVPLLASVTTKQHFLSFGTYGGNWWIPLVTASVGAVILVAGFQRLTRVLWAAGHAATAGHGWRTVLHVLADSDRDTGFLIQGIRRYSGVSPAERKTILTARLASAIVYLAAVLWVPLAASLSVVMAALGWIGPGTIWLVTAVLPLLLLGLGVLSRVAATLLARSTRRARPLVEEQELASEIQEWCLRLNDFSQTGAFHPGASERRRAFRITAGLVVLAGVLSIVPLAAVTLSGTIGQALASFALGFRRVGTNVARVEVLRGYRVDPDATVSPEGAGEALHAILRAGVLDVPPMMRAPVRSYDEPWFDPDAAREVSGSEMPSEWVLDAIARAGAGGLSAPERTLVRRMAAHPAHREFATVASARTVDIVGGRWIRPFAEDALPWTLPLPGFSTARDAATAHLALAADQLSRGRVSQAEQSVREVISVGFALIDDAPTMIDNMIGVALVTRGGDALQRLYEATGRRAEARSLSSAREQVDRVLERVMFIGGAGDIASIYEAFPGFVTDSTVARGARWEFFSMAAAFAGCLNLHTIVFGPGEEYEVWRAAARQSLARLPSEGDYFDFLERGPFGTGGCGTLFDQLRAVRSLY